jgi:hypothetical protein
MPTVLYDSDTVQALHHEGSAAHGSLVHFSGALINQGQTPPWARATFSKWQGDTILISPRDKSYFARDLVAPLLACLPALRAPVIVMGSSMGGMRR